MSEGGCTCGRVRYRLTAKPIVVHCCHCTWCQRETGTAFALNALIDTARVELTGEAPERIVTPSASGKGQIICRCPECRIAVWSHYPGAGEKVSFIRVGTLDNPAACPPDVHIFTSSKQPWVVIPPSAERFDDYYKPGDVPRLYGNDGAARWQALFAR